MGPEKSAQSHLNWLCAEAGGSEHGASPGRGGIWSTADLGWVDAACELAAAILTLGSLGGGDRPTPRLRNLIAQIPTLGFCRTSSAPLRSRIMRIYAAYHSWAGANL